jgi:hypothetical protein
MSDPINEHVNRIREEAQERNDNETALHTLLGEFADWATRHNVPTTNRRGWEFNLPYTAYDGIDEVETTAPVWARSDGTLQVNWHARGRVDFCAKKTLEALQRQVAQYVHDTGHPWP